MEIEEDKRAKRKFFDWKRRQQQKLDKNAEVLDVSEFLWRKDPKETRNKKRRINTQEQNTSKVVQKDIGTTYISEMGRFSIFCCGGQVGGMAQKCDRATSRPIADAQNIIKEEISPKLTDKGINIVQQVVGICLYYGRAIEDTILPALSAIASEQTTATEATMSRIIHLLDYLATHPDEVIMFKASDMILNVH